MTKKEKKRQNETAEILIILSSKIKSYTRKNIPVRFNYHLLNTGVVEGPSDSSQNWITHYDLGGRLIKLEIDFPNQITLIEAFKK